MSLPALRDDPVALLEQGCRVLADAVAADEALRVRAVAGAAEAYARQAKLGREAENMAAELRVRAERRAGELLRESVATGERHTGHGDQKSGSQPATPKLQDLGISKDESSRYQKLAAVPAPAFEKYVAEQKATGERITSTGARNAAVVRTLGSSESDEWYTPASYTDAARRVMGDIDLDPASCASANEQIKARRIYTIHDDGLAQEWRGRVFMNPPFSRSAAFVDRLLREYDAGNVSQAIILCAARAETRWFHPLFDHTICFPDHRVKFWAPGRVPAPPFTPAFAYLGSDVQKFAGEFSRFGSVVRRV